MAMSDQIVYLNRKALQHLVKDPNSFVVMVKSRYEVALEPYHYQDMEKSIFSVVRQDIGKFCQPLNGIMLGIQNVVLLSPYGMLYGSSPTSYNCIQAEFFVFRAAVGNVLKGTVNLIGKVCGRIGCLVHQTFNVTIPKPVDDDTWLGDYVELGAEVSFEIIEMDFFHGMPYIRGALREILSKPSGGFGEANNETEQQTTEAQKSSPGTDEDSISVPNETLESAKPEAE